ncbi:DUF429 domain-containing protein [Cellulomonas endophytica]|uniref:DUF429 domain-containing protein n=1 Tax=Cellulomonas endophytica TaxID=2494735 RepID=UPI001011F6EF|nr:DUF429 domain-containing protein [Cellulomonas endophytica]
MTRFVGIDLAWGPTARTGVAVLDEAGCLVHSSSVVTDEELDAVVRTHTAGAPVVSAIDAPLVVPNLTGMRPAERLVTQHFGRYAAGAYPANRSNRHFDPPRGERLAQRHGWTVDPDVRPDAHTSVAIEVYPHPAMVVLFGLERVIPYKSKPGRDLESRSAAWRVLLDHLERVAGPLLGLASNARWQHLRDAAVQATRPVDLDRIEDEVDAIVCAHLAWLWATERDRMVVLGTVEDGYIVVPGLPTPPAPRRPARAAAPVGLDGTEVRHRRAVEAVLVEMPSLTRDAAERLVRVVAAELSSSP